MGAGNPNEYSTQPVRPNASQPPPPAPAPQSMQEYLYQLMRQSGPFQWGEANMPGVYNGIRNTRAYQYGNQGTRAVQAGAAGVEVPWWMRTVGNAIGSMAQEGSRDFLNAYSQSPFSNPVLAQAARSAAQGIPLTEAESMSLRAAGWNQVGAAGWTPPNGGNPNEEADRIAAWQQAGQAGMRPPDANLTGGPLQGVQPGPVNGSWMPMSSRQRLLQMANNPIGLQNVAPPPWYQQPNWSYQPGGDSMFANLPDDPNIRAQYAAMMAEQLPWAQMSQQDRYNAFQQDLANRQFGSAEQQAEWERNFRGQDQGFNQWLAEQQLGLQQQQAGADNGWRQRQMDLQQQQQQFTQEMERLGFTTAQAQQAWQNNFQTQDWQRAGQQWQSQFDANRADAQFGQEFQTRDWERAGQQWQSQFDANRNDRAWDQSFQTRDWERAGQWNERDYAANRDDTMWMRGTNQRDFDANRADRSWDQTFQSGQFDWQRQMDQERNKLQEQGQNLAAFNRKFGPAIGWM